MNHAASAQAPHTVDPGELDDPSWPVLCMVNDHRGPHATGEHRHLRAQVVYAAHGVMTVHTASGTWVVPPEQAVWVPAGTLHDVRCPGALRMRSLYIHPDAVSGLPAQCCVLGVPALLRELILRAVGFDPSGAATVAQSRLMSVILDELRGLEPSPLHLPLPADARLKSVTDALIRDPADGRSLRQWARRTGASDRTLARLFVRDTGMSFGHWRQQLRLLRAISLLAAGEAVTSVAYEVGYSSPSAFVAMFRRTLGATPGRFLRGNEP